MESLLQVPKRRAVSEIKRELGSMTGGDTARVLFSNNRHGPFLVSGSVHSNSLNDLVLAAIPLAGATVSVSDKTGDWVSRKPEEDVRVILSGVGTAIAGEIHEPNDIRHGDLVDAEFEQSPYGVFRIFGVATESLPAGTTMVGGWIISGHGVANTRLKEIRLVAAPREHGVSVPPKRPPLSTNVA